MKKGGAGRIISRNLAAGFITWAGFALAVEIFSGNASCYLLLVGIIFCMAIPYTAWGLKIMYRKVNRGKWDAVDFHPRAKNDYRNNRPKVKELLAGNDGGQPFLAGGKSLFSAVLVCCRLDTTESGRQPNNPG